MALRDGVQVFTAAQVPQGSEAWRSVRLGVLTGSRSAPVMVAKRPSDTRDKLIVELVVERRTGKSARVDFQSDAMAQGLDREPDARREAEAEMLTPITEIGFAYWVGKRAGCSPDGVIGDWDELVSIKCRELKAHYQHLRWGTIPADALRQMAHELWIAGGCRVHNYVSYNPDFEPSLRYKRVRLTWEQLKVDEYAQAAEAFLREVQIEHDAMASLVAKGPWALALEHEQQKEREQSDERTTTA